MGGDLLRKFLVHHQDTIQRIVLFRANLTEGAWYKILETMRNLLELEFLHLGDIREKKQRWHLDYAIDGTYEQLFEAVCKHGPVITLGKNGVEPFLNDIVSLFDPMVFISWPNYVLVVLPSIPGIGRLANQEGRCLTDECCNLELCWWDTNNVRGDVREVREVFAIYGVMVSR